MDKLYDMLQDVRKCPSLYLGKPSLERLDSYIGGFLHHYEWKLDNTCLDGFNEYIAKIYHIETDHNWSSIIRFFCNTEEEAFIRFYEHLDAYIQNH